MKSLTKIQYRKYLYTSCEHYTLCKTTFAFRKFWNRWCLPVPNETHTKYPSISFELKNTFGVFPEWVYLLNTPSYGTERLETPLRITRKKQFFLFQSVLFICRLLHTALLFVMCWVFSPSFNNICFQRWLLKIVKSFHKRHSTVNAHMLQYYQLRKSHNTYSSVMQYQWQNICRHTFVKAVRVMYMYIRCMVMTFNHKYMSTSVHTLLFGSQMFMCRHNVTSL